MRGKGEKEVECIVFGSIRRVKDAEVTKVILIFDINWVKGGSFMVCGWGLRWSFEWIVVDFVLVGELEMFGGSG